MNELIAAATAGSEPETALPPGEGPFLFLVNA